MPEKSPLSPDATNIPIQYRDMPADIVEELWQPTIFLDPDRTQQERCRRAEALIALRAQEARQSQLDETAGNRIRASLGLHTQVQPHPLLPDELKEIKNIAIRCIRRDPEANFLGLIGEIDDQGHLQSTAIDWRIGQRFDAHGIRKGTRNNPTIGGDLDSLLQFLQSGIDTSRDFHSAPLEVDPDTRAAVGAGLGTSGTAYQDGSFILLSDIDRRLDKDGIHSVIVNPAYHHAITRLQQAFPTVTFIPSNQANILLSQVVKDHDQGQ